DQSALRVDRPLSVVNPIAPQIHVRPAVICNVHPLSIVIERHFNTPIDLRPDRAYSPASIGKAYLRAMGIVEPMRKFKDLPPKIHGIAMAAYYGGRAEYRIRRWPVPVVPVDLTSEYPSVDALLGIWDVLTAARLTTGDPTKDVRALLSNITLDDLFRP